MEFDYSAKMGERIGYEVVKNGEYHGHRYQIGMVYGPVAYIEVDKEIDDFEPCVYGGVTWKGKGKARCENDLVAGNKYYYGWDYEHGGDYSKLYEMYPDDVIRGCFTRLKKWTIEEVMEDVMAAIDSYDAMAREGEKRKVRAYDIFRSFFWSRWF